MTKPFDGAISDFYEKHAPTDIQSAIADADKKDILDPSYPYDRAMRTSDYQDEMDDLQVELVKVQSWAKETGKRIAIVFEGRDAAGKGGTIKRFRENLNPRSARVVALSKPTETERSQWYFQRYIKHLPSAGEIVMFDRSWYNRGVVEKVFGFCTDTQREQFFNQVNDFEQMLINDGIILIKLWLNVGRGEQLRRFLGREGDRLKHWKLSGIDVKGLSKWDEYTSAINETMDQSSSRHAPWQIIRTDDKKRARLAAIRTVLQHLDYPSKSTQSAKTPDTLITGGPEILG
jgi:polyphosphate kinase 2